MLDIKSLERRWLKYKIKYYLPFIGIGLAALCISFVFIWWLNTDNTKDKPVAQSILTVEANKTHIQETRIPIEKNVTILEPSMDFVQSFENKIPENSPESKQIATKIPVPMSKPVTSAPPPTVLNVPEPPTVNPAPSDSVTISDSKKTLTINRNESKLDIDELQKRFKETSNANLGLFIARYYYDHENYADAYNYALKTNSVNNKIDESWIIFSKSLVKLGKTDQAKKTLQLYISQSNSDTAKELLNSIERGNFK